MKTPETLKIEATLHKQRDRIWTIVPTRNIISSSQSASNDLKTTIVDTIQQYIRYAIEFR